MFSVVVPTLNRLENLKMCLAALKRQTWQDFEVIVVDDGSTDGTLEWLKSLDCADSSPDRVWLLKAGPNKGFNGGRVRNIGAFNANGDRVIFIDSDVLLAPDAIERYDEAHNLNPSAAIVGLYHSLPPMVVMRDDVINRFDDIANERLALTNEPYNGPWYFADRRFPRRDPREDDFRDDPSILSYGDGLGSFCGNVSYPTQRFWEIGGFDERLPGYGGEDAEIGLNWDEHEFPWVLYRRIVGYHVHHYRDQDKNRKEVQVNIDYIDRKYGVGKYREAKKWTDSQEWNDWHHYTRDLGAILTKAEDNDTVYVVRDEHRLGLTSPEWINALGFTSDDLKIVPPYAFDGIREEGATPEWDQSLSER